MRPLDSKIDDLLSNTLKQAKHQQGQWLSIYLDRQTNYTCIIILHLSDFFNGIHITKFIGLVILLFLIYLMCCALFVKFSKKSSPFFTQCQIDVLTQDVKIASFKQCLIKVNILSILIFFASLDLLDDNVFRQNVHVMLLQNHK